MNKKLSIITLTYNQLENATKPYINSLFEHTNKDLFDLIIIDNASTDGTVEYLKQLKKENDNITVICNSENKGYSKGNNQGLKIANGECIGLLNNDILLSPNWYKPLFEKLQNKETGIVSPSVLQSVIVKENHFLKTAQKAILKSENDYQETVKCDFSCVIFKQELVNMIGYLDENFSPAYFEDDDFCVRAILAGYKNYFSNKSYIYHKTSSTSTKLPEFKSILNRNKEYFFEKYKNNPFIRYWYECDIENKYIKPRYEKVKSYKSTSLKYYLNKIF